MAKAVTFVGEGEFGDGRAVASEGADEPVGLLGRDDVITAALDDENRASDPIGVVEWGALLVGGGRVGPRADEAVGVVTLEAGDVGPERGEIGDTEPAHPGGEPIGGGQRAKRGEPTGTGAADNGAAGVGVAPLDEECGNVDAVAHVQDAPPPVELGAEGTAVAGAAAIVHVDHGEAAVGEELGAQLQPDAGVAGRAGMRLDDQRWRLPGRCR